MKETCLTVNGVVTNDWSFKDMAHIELPTTCSLSSEKINCGALKLTSSEDTVVEAEPSRGNDTVSKDDLFKFLDGEVLGLGKLY